MLKRDTEIIVTVKGKAKRDDVKYSHEFPTIFLSYGRVFSKFVQIKSVNNNNVSSRKWADQF